LDKDLGTKDPGGDPMGIGTYQKRERRYIAEWAYSKFPNATIKLNVPLGPIPKSLEEEVGLYRALRVFRPWRAKADAIVILPDKLIAAEADIRDPRRGLSDLLIYRDLIDLTPELESYKNLPKEFWIVVPWVTTWVKEYAEKNNIKIDIYCPDWIKDYIEELQKYYTPEGREKREERRRRLEGLV
jgi:hypothetical protein